METGFQYAELDKFRQGLINETLRLFPKETDNFLKKEGQKQSRIQKKVAKQEVGTSGSKKSYHKGFKVGKIYDYYDKSRNIRAYNNSPHAHFIENGHYQVARGESRNKGGGRRSGEGGTPNGWVDGKEVIKKAQVQFNEQFFSDCDEFLGQYFDNVGGAK